MTKNSDFKQRVRERMAKTGESYTTAKRQLEANQQPVPTLRGWAFTGPGDGTADFEITDYEGGLEPELRHNGKACAFVRSIVDAPQSHAVIMQNVDSLNYHGKRVRFSAMVRCDSDTTVGHLWVRVVPLGKDNSYAWGRAHATTEWQRGEIVVDIDPRSAEIMFGVSLHGRGHVWMSDANFEVVDATVPLTGKTWDEDMPAEPVNLSFEEG